MEKPKFTGELSCLNCNFLMSNQKQESEKLNMKIEELVELIVKAEEIFNTNYIRDTKDYRGNSFISEIFDNTREMYKRIETHQILSKKDAYEDFICLLCMKLTNNPNLCVSCDKSCCLECEIKLNNGCPHCMNQPYVTRSFVRFEKKFFDSIEVKCPYDCGEILLNENYNTHLNTCIKKIKTFICNNCKKIIETSASNEEMTNDHMRICRKACNFCHEDYSLMYYIKHEANCLERIIINLKKFIEKSKQNQQTEEFKTIVRCLRNILDS